MRLNQPEEFAVAQRAIEAELGVRYPETAPQLLAELSGIVGTAHYHRVLERARLLVITADVIAQRGELGELLIENEYLLPFMVEENGEWPDVYGFDATGCVAVYSVHTIVEEWESPAAFLHWVRTFVP